MTAAQAFERLVQIMHRLRGPGGCPWDGEQTHQSIKPYLIEEAYQVIEAIDRGDDRELRSELGDLLLQIVFHAEMASETDRFDIADVVRTIGDKMVRRHPHVFGDTAVTGTADVLRNWSRIKAEERKNDEDRSALAGVPRGMPALLRAQRLGEKASHTGFDWSEARAVLAKLHEELGEIETALLGGRPGGRRRRARRPAVCRHVTGAAPGRQRGGRLARRRRPVFGSLSPYGGALRPPGAGHPPDIGGGEGVPVGGSETAHGMKVHTGTPIPNDGKRRLSRRPRTIATGGSAPLPRAGHAGMSPASAAFR